MCVWFSGLFHIKNHSQKAYITRITHRIVTRDHQHTHETKEGPYQAPKAHTLRTGTFATPSFYYHRSLTIKGDISQRPGTSETQQVERVFFIPKFRLGILDYLSRIPIFSWKFPFGKKKIVLPFAFHPKFPDFSGKW